VNQPRPALHRPDIALPCINRCGKLPDRYLTVDSIFAIGNISLSACGQENADMPAKFRRLTHFKPSLRSFVHVMVKPPGEGMACTADMDRIWVQSGNADLHLFAHGVELVNS